MIGLLHKKREEQIKKHLRAINERREKARRKGRERTELKSEKKQAKKREKRYISDRKMLSILIKVKGPALVGRAFASLLVDVTA